MGWLQNLFRRKTWEKLVGAESLATRAKASDTADLGRDRLIVVDVETTGLSLQRDSLLSIGAVAITQGRIQLADQFDITLKVDPGRRLFRSVLVHGLSPEDLASGVEPREALSRFLKYVGDDPLFAFHARFDQHMLMKAVREYLDAPWSADFTDVAEIAAWVEPDRKEPASLDDWLREYRLTIAARHCAAADAMATAELLLVLIRQLQAREISTLGQLREKLNLGRKLQVHRI